MIFVVVLGIFLWGSLSCILSDVYVLITCLFDFEVDVLESRLNFYGPRFYLNFTQPFSPGYHKTVPELSITELSDWQVRNFLSISVGTYAVMDSQMVNLTLSLTNVNILERGDRSSTVLPSTLISLLIFTFVCALITRMAF